MDVITPQLTFSYTEAWLSGFDGTKFYTRTWEAPSPGPKAVTLYLHGFADHIARYDDVHTRWAQRGVTVFAYDLRGFGRTALDDDHKSDSSSYGKTNHLAELQDVEWWINYLDKKYPGIPIFLMGYSAVRPTPHLVFCRSLAPPIGRFISHFVCGAYQDAPPAKRDL